MSAPSLVGWAVEAAIASALLIAAVLVLRAPVRRAFGPQVAYGLWALPLLRLALPPMPAAWREAAAPPLARAGETIVTAVIAPLARPVAAVSSGSGMPVATILLALWAIGAVGFLAWHIVRHALFCRRVLAGATAVDTVAGIRVIASDAAMGPVAFGVFRRYVAFPAGFAALYAPRERDLALAHEIGHQLRGDLIANWAALGVLAVHWYDPIAWIAFRAFRADQEMANDARVLARHEPVLRHAYACAIVKSVHGGAVSAACHLHTVNDLKGRLKMIGTNPVSWRRLAAGAAFLSLATAGGLGLTASGSATAAALKTGVGTTIGADLQAAPLPPAPPAPAPRPIAPRAPAPPAGSDRTEDIRTVATDDGKVVRTRLIWVRGGDGGGDAIPGMPEVSSVDCHTDGKGTLYAENMTVTKTQGARKIVVICSDRVAEAAAEGARTGVEVAADGADIERGAMATARDGLRTARAAIERERNLTDAQRREALAGLDEARTEIDAQIAGGE